MNRYIPEVGIAIILLLGGIWMVPSHMSVEEPSQPIVIKQQQDVADTSLNESKKEEDWRQTPTRMSKALKRRNIFDPNGKYDQPDGKAQKSNNANKDKSQANSAVENTFTLVAVLQGEAPSAVFRDSAGSLRLHHEGDRLTKQAQITRISKLSVTVHNGNKEEVYKIFHIEGEELLAVKGQSKSAEE
jgi:hypothetical protein